MHLLQKLFVSSEAHGTDVASVVVLMWDKYVEVKRSTSGVLEDIKDSKSFMGPTFCF